MFREKQTTENLPGVELAGMGIKIGGNGMALPAMSEAQWWARRDRSLPERLLIASLLCDSVVIVYALLTSFWLRFCTPLNHFGVVSGATLHGYAGYIACGTISLILSLMYFQIYDSQKLLRFRHVALRMTKAASLWFFVFLSLALIFKFQPSVSRIFVVISAVNVTVSLLLWRWAFHRFLHASTLAASLRQRVLFVGWNDEAERMAGSLESDPESPLQVVGCVSPTATGRGRFAREPLAPILGEQGDLADLIRQHAIDMVVLTDVDCVKGEIIGLANLCEKEMVQFKVIPSYFQILVSGLRLETVNGIPVLGVSLLALDQTFNLVMKRVVDIIGALIGLAIFAPVIAVFATLVYLESPGPVFYRQRRMGRNGIPFHIIKIRSMRLDAESGTGARWAQKDDPRRLAIGAFMRKWNIDETPQFWNVLKGEMSLVGPRPERPELIENFKEEIPHYNARHNAKPGITGWAQVKGLRGDTDLTERIKCDLYYQENWSLLLDFQIMFMTFKPNENAY